MQAELLKLKNNPLGILLLALGPLGMALIFALQGSSTIRIELATDLRDLWSVPMHLVMVLLLPYLLTLERQLDTEKWLWTTPTRPWQLMMQKWSLCLLIAVIFGILSMLIVYGHYNSIFFLRQFLIALSSSITFTLLSLFLGSFGGILVVAVVWSAISGYFLLLFPDNLRLPLQAMIPGMKLSDFASGEYQGLRICAHLILISCIGFFMHRKMPRW